MYAKQEFIFNQTNICGNMHPLICYYHSSMSKFNYTCRQPQQVLHWLLVQFAGWLADLLTDWLTDRLIDSLVDLTHD